MRLFLLITLTMLAFASNSILNRMALAMGGIDAVSFGTIRLAAGAVMLSGLCVVLRGRMRLRGPGRIVGVLALLAYIYGFSTAYTALDAGLGALILFGVVQITMFAASLIAREVVSASRWIGAGLSFAGLMWLLWPGSGGQMSLTHGGLMAIAGVGWGLYSLAGRVSDDALMSTAANFLLAAPFGVLFSILLPASSGSVITSTGVLLAILCGAVTSGLGYAMWYRVMPRLDRSVAAVAQLTVPVIAMAGGMLLLGEVPSVRFVLAGLLVLGGVAFSVLAGRAR